MGLMNKSQFQALLAGDIHKSELEVAVEGHSEYAHGTDNPFYNFEKVAAALGLSREEVLMVYMMKHIDGIAAWVKGHRSQREGVKGRIKDARMYLALLWGMVEEGESGLMSADEIRDAIYKNLTPDEISLSYKPSETAAVELPSEECRCKDSGGYYPCSLYSGHGGKHIAYAHHDINKGTVLETWGDEPSDDHTQSEEPTPADEVKLPSCSCGSRCQKSPSPDCTFSCSLPRGHLGLHLGLHRAYLNHIIDSEHFMAKWNSELIED